MKDEIKQALQKALVELGIEGVEAKIEEPADASKGDYASNIALAIFSNSKFNPSIKLRTGIQNSKFRTPLDMANEIVSLLNTKYLIHNTEKIEAVNPGFINFWISQEYLVKNLGQVLDQKDTYGQATHLRPFDSAQGSGGQRKTMMEFGDPNPFKEFHIGHLRNITLGESLARLLEAQKAEIWRVNYQGDVGMHVAKAIFGMKSLQDTMPQEGSSLREKIEFLGKAYAYGANAYETNEAAKKEIQSINIKSYQGDKSAKNLWDIGKQWSLAHFEEIYSRVGTKYKHYYFESATAPLGRELVVNNVQTGIFEASDGAIIFRGEKEGLHTRVFVTKENYATYEGKDMALAKLKYDDYTYDRSIIITAHEQAQYFRVVLAALKQLFPQLAAKTEHYSFGFVQLKEGKMSSRTGNVITGEWLLDEAKRRIQKAFKDMDEETAEKVAVGAVKYSMLKFSRESDISFSFDESISLEGNSGPYLQYTFARTQSVLRKWQMANGKWQNHKQYAISDKLEVEEIALLRLLAKFPKVVTEAGDTFSPNILANHLFELAQGFNLFYQKHSILGRNDNANGFRLALTVAVGQVLKNGLYLLGIQAPEKM